MKNNDNNKKINIMENKIEKIENEKYSKKVDNKDIKEQNSNIVNIKKEEEIKVEKKEEIKDNKKVEEIKVDKEKEEDKDNKIKVEEKAKSPKKILSSIVTTGKEKINDIYLKKVNDLSNIFNYTSNYLDFIIQIFKKISEPFYSKLSSSYINNVKPYLKYFKELVTILNTFSEKMNLLNSSIEDKKDENGEEDLIRVENNLNSAVKKMNNIFANTSSAIVKNLRENILNKPLFTKYESIESKFEENFHKMLNLISQLEGFRIKYNNQFNRIYLNIFNMYIQKYNEIDNYLVTMKDFFLIEYDIINSANYSIKRVDKFIKDIRKLYDDSTNIFCDYLEILKIMIKIYYEENKKIILPNILSEKMINDLEKLVGQDIRKNIEKKFCIKNIIEHYRDEALRNEINHLLLKYQEILSQYKIIKTEEINNLSLFNLKHFKSTDIFFNFLISLLPKKFELFFEDGIQFKTDVKRDCGLFKGWKQCHLVISYQGHILFFDEDGNLKNEQTKKRSKSGYTKNLSNSVIAEKKNLGLSEINTEIGKRSENILRANNNDEDSEELESKYGISPEKLSIMYYKTNYGIRKKNNKQGKFLFELWEKGAGNKKNKINNFDALDRKNLENILLELTETNIYDD